MRGLAAISSPKLLFNAKWALRLLFEALPVTPATAKRALDVHKTKKRIVGGKTGDSASRIIAVSQSMSDARRYALHSASIEVPSRWANVIVEIRPVHSRIMLTSIAPVGEADASPTPIPEGCQFVVGEVVYGTIMMQEI